MDIPLLCELNIYVFSLQKDQMPCTPLEFILTTFVIYYQHSITISIPFQRMVTVAVLASLTPKRKEKRNKGRSEGEGGRKDRRKEQQRRKKKRNKEGRRLASVNWGGRILCNPNVCALVCTKQQLYSS